jgi:hypothetical protein
VASLYRRLLGDAFDSLPPAVQRFHDQVAGGEACLVFRFSGGKSWLCRAGAAIARLPKAGTETRGWLRVQVEGNRERWIREIGGRRLETVQGEQHGLLVESTGPLRLGFRVAGSSDGMRFTCVRGWFCGLPLPTPMAPRVTAAVVGREDGWWVNVRVELPVMGLLLRYEGEVTPR